MTTRGEINSNFYQIVDVDANGAPTLVKPEYIGPVSQVDANIANVHISGGTDGYVLQTDGTGNLTWTAQTGGSGNGVPGGSNTQVQFNDAGSFGGDDDFRYYKATQTLTANNFSANNANLGQLYVEGNIQSNSSVYVGYTANLTGLTNPTIIAKASGATFVQAAVVNGSPNGSADYVTYGDNGSDSGSFADMGFTGSNFDDPLYTITGINDGYFFVQGDDSSAYGGNLVIATGAQGFKKDIVFATGGFLSEDEKMRYIHSEGQLYIQPNTVSSNTTTGALRVAGGVGVGGDINAGNIVSANFFVGDGSFLSNITANTAANANYASFAGQIVDNSQPNITSLGPLTGLAVAGNIVAGNSVSANFFVGDGGFLSNLTFTGNVANANYANFAGNALSVAAGNIVGVVANANYASFAGTVLTNAQPYITSLGLVTSLTVTGNLAALNISGNGAAISSVTGANVTGIVGNATHANVADLANSVAVANVTGIGNIATVNLNGSTTEVLYGNGVFANISANISANFAAYAGNVTVNSQPNITSVGTLTSLAVTGNVSANVYSGNGSGLTNLTGANVTGVVANATTAVSATTAGTVTTNAQPNITSVGTLTSLAVTGNISANVYSGNGSGLTSITGANVTGIVGNATHANVADLANSIVGSNVTGQVANALVAGTVYTNVQPNITSLGTLTSLTVAGNLSVTSNGVASLGNVGNVKIAGGTTGQVLTTDGTSNLSWTTVSGGGGTPGGSNTNIQYNNAGAFAGTDDFKFIPIDIANNIAPTVNLGYVGANTGSGVYAGGRLLFTTSNSTSELSRTGAGASGAMYIQDAYQITIDSPIISVGSNANFKLSGGSSGQILSTDGSGSLSWVSSTGSPGGANTQLQFNNSGSFGGISTVTYDGSNISLGAITSVKITGGSSGQVISTDGAGNLSFVAQSGGGSSDPYTPVFLLGGM